jgi:hypothetical protein
MSDSNPENTDSENDRSQNEKDQKQGNSKSDRLDRLESKIEMLQDGILLLVNMVGWMNATVTPIGTHNPDVDFMGHEDLDDAIREGLGDDDESGK